DVCQMPPVNAMAAVDQKASKFHQSRRQNQSISAKSSCMAQFAGSTAAAGRCRPSWLRSDSSHLANQPLRIPVGSSCLWAMLQGLGFFTAADEDPVTIVEQGGATAAPDLIKETTTQTFVKDVIEESKRQPVLIDFWAPRCGPCRQLTPIL